MKTILIVEDEARIGRAYKMLLTADGYNVIGVSSAEEANEILKRQAVDLVLLDLRMPDVSGDILYEVMQLFHKKTKVMVSSVYHVDKQRELIQEAADYYDKSQGIAELLKKIRALLPEMAS